MSKLLIKNGRIIDPETNKDEISDILIVNDKISKIGKIEDIKNVKIIDASNKVIIPGIIDIHVHLRDMEQSDKETVETGTEAAIKGGVTTVYCMPNTSPKLDSVKNIKKYQKLINNAKIDVHIVGAITHSLMGKELADINSYSDLGIQMITDDGFDIDDESVLEVAYKKAKELGLIVMTHPEMHSIAKDGVINEGKISKILNIPGQPNEKEWKAVERGIRIATKIGARAHFTHISTKESVDLIRQIKKTSDFITCDVTPHHIFFTEKEVLEKSSMAKVNPPLRTEADRLSLIEGIKDGTVDLIITDHAPHTEKDKSGSLENSAFGFSEIEISLPVCLTELYHNQGIDLIKVIELMTLAPAKIMNIPVGRIQEGLIANLVIVDLNTEKKVDRNQFISKGKNTPFHGEKLKGWPKTTIYRGNVY